MGHLEETFETLEEAVEYIDQHQCKDDERCGCWTIEDRDGNNVKWTHKRNAYDLAYDSIRIIEQATKKDDLGNLTHQQLQDIITKVYDILSEVWGM